MERLDLPNRVFGNRSDSTIDVAVGDLNQDGHPDLVHANRDAQQNVVVLNDGNGGFDRRIPFGSGSDETAGSLSPTSIVMANSIGSSTISDRTIRFIWVTDQAGSKDR